MIILPEMLVDAAEKAGMKVPPDPDDFDKNQFPHFDVFCKVQLCRPVRWGEHWENAKVVANVPEEELKSLTVLDLMNRGLEFHT